MGTLSGGDMFYGEKAGEDRSSADKCHLLI